MSQITKDFPSYIPLFKCIYGLYLEKFDSRNYIEFITKTVNLSVYSLKNTDMFNFFRIDDYLKVNPEITSARSMHRVGLIMNEESTFDFSTDEVIFTHVSGNKIILKIKEADINNLQLINYTNEQIEIVKMYHTILAKTNNEYFEVFCKDKPFMHNIKLVSIATGKFALVDSNLKDFIFNKIIEIIFE